MKILKIIIISILILFSIIVVIKIKTHYFALKESDIILTMTCENQCAKLYEFNNSYLIMTEIYVDKDDNVFEKLVIIKK